MILQKEHHKIRQNTIICTHYLFGNDEIDGKNREFSDFSTYYMWRNLKLLHMWRDFRILHTCHVETFEITPHVEKFQNSPHLSCTEIWNFSTWQIFLHRYICGICDKYEVWSPDILVQLVVINKIKRDLFAFLIHSDIERLIMPVTRVWYQSKPNRTYLSYCVCPSL